MVTQMSGNKESGKKTTRRGYLKYVGGAVGAAVVAAAGYGIYETTKPPPTPPSTPTITAATTIPPAQPITFRLAYSTEVPTIDPADGSTVNLLLQSPVYDTLVRPRPGTMELDEPVLATSWDISPDGKTYTFKLRQGAKFHDGTLLTAEAVKFSAERTMKIGKMSSTFLGPLDTVDVIDDYTVRFNLKEPYVPFLAALSSPAGLAIVSPTTVKKHEIEGDLAQEWLGMHEAGSGPYVLENWVREQNVSFAKFKEYWRGWEGKHIDNIVGYFVREEATRKLMLLNGDVDWAEDLIPENADEIAKRPGFVVQYDYGAGICSLVLNLRRAFSDANLRKAVSYAFDYKSAIQGIWMGHADQAQGPLPYNSFGHKDDLTIYSRDLDKAKDYMKKSKYSPGQLTLQVIYNVGYDWKAKTAQLFKSNMNDIGINVEIVETTWPVLWDSLNTPTAPYDVWVYFNSLDIPDPFMVLLRSYHSDPKKGLYNKGYKNSKVDELLNSAAKSVDRAEYASLLREIQSIVVEEAAQVFLYDLKLPRTYRDYLKGFVPDAANVFAYNYYDMYIEGRD